MKNSFSSNLPYIYQKHYTEMICENCQKDSLVKYGSGRFCSSKCARGFSTKLKRKEISRKVSKTLSEKPWPRGKYAFSKEHCHLGALSSARSKRLKKQNLLNWESSSKFSLRGQRRLAKFLLEKESNKCRECGIDSWMNKKISLQLHHIDGNKLHNQKENVTLLCPNCHTQTDTWGFKKARRVS